MTSKSILIVEDEIMVAMDIERILVDAGYHVVAIASDKMQAISAGAKADAAFIDLNLRDGPTGPQIALELAQQYGTKVVYVTANPAQIDVPAPTSIGYIRKPFSDPAILAAAALALEGLEADHEDLVRFPVKIGGSAPNPESAL